MGVAWENYEYSGGMWECERIGLPTTSAPYVGEDTVVVCAALLQCPPPVLVLGKILFHVGHVTLRDDIASSTVLIEISESQFRKSSG